MVVTTTGYGRRKSRHDTVPFGSFIRHSQFELCRPDFTLLYFTRIPFLTETAVVLLSAPVVQVVATHR